jgi:DNA-directed RNA polymerase specialized sigma24 family protein
MSDTTTERRQELERLFGSDGARIWRALLAFAGDADVANEARAEAFAQALAHGDEIRSPAAWVWTTSFRIAKGLLKERSRRSDSRACDVAYSIPDPVRDLVDALKTLPPQQRLAIVLHDYADHGSRGDPRLEPSDSSRTSERRSQTIAAPAGGAPRCVKACPS